MTGEPLHTTSEMVPHAPVSTCVDSNRFDIVKHVLHGVRKWTNLRRLKH